MDSATPAVCFTCAVIWFEGKGTITVDTYTAKKVLTTNEFRNLLKGFIERTKNKSLKDLVGKWDRFQIAKKNNEIGDSAIYIYKETRIEDVEENRTRRILLIPSF